MRRRRESRARRNRIRPSLPVALAGVGLLLGPPAASAQDPGRPICRDFAPETKEIDGPTDIGATLANEHLSVAVSPEGTLSVFRWPSRSYYEQLKYFTIDRDLPLLGLQPNEGAFSGLALRRRDGGEEMVWLRDLRSRQRYASPDSDTVTTRYRSAELGLKLEIADVVPRAGDVLMRRHLLRLRPGSPVRRARLIVLANLNPTASKRPFLPTEDWCEENRATDVAAYDADADAIVYSITELDQSLLAMRSVAVAIGAKRPSAGHQVGADSYTEDPVPGPESAYDDAADGELSGNDSLGPAEVDAALALRIRRRPVTVTFAAGANADEAIAELDRFRSRGARRQVRAKRRSELGWMRDAPLPRDAPPAVTRLAKRALVSLHQAIDRNAGADGDAIAIVASLATQSPYFLDWIRDGAFFNEALDLIGHPGLVRRHNLFYAETQHRLSQGAPPGSPLSICAQPIPPDGNWFMTNYTDGRDAGLIPWEIDEAGFGLWTLYRHHVHLRRAGRAAAARAYLEEIYPTLRRTAEFLVVFRDPLTKLPPGTACEDDVFPPPGQATMHSAGTVLLAMRSAEAAAKRLGRTADANRYRARRVELEAAIDERYNVAGGAWTTDFGVGGWALWPIRVRPYNDPRSRAQAEAAWASVAPSFEAPDGPRDRGQYEAKALHGLAYFHRAVDPAGVDRVKRGLRWVAGVQAAYQRTGILGEVWFMREGELLSVLDQPHVWEQILFYLAALKAYGREPYRSGAPDRLMRWRR